MKPHIYLLKSWTDCGWPYQWWRCSGDAIVGQGYSPRSAYMDWLAKQGEA